MKAIFIWCLRLGAWVCRFLVREVMAWRGFSLMATYCYLSLPSINVVRCSHECSLHGSS
jgi:hypothetical protein